MQFATGVSIAPLTCNLSQLSVRTTDPYPHQHPILNQDEPFSLQVTVEFGGAGAIALMPLEMCIQVEFCAEPFGAGATVELGKVSINTIGNVFTYTPLLTVTGSPLKQLNSGKVYQIKALIRVGAANYPAFVVGLISGLLIQLYQDNSPGEV